MNVKNVTEKKNLHSGLSQMFLREKQIKMNLIRNNILDIIVLKISS